MRDLPSPRPRTAHHAGSSPSSTTQGKTEFDDEIENPAFEGSPQLTVDRTIEAGDIVVVTGEGIGHHREDGRFRFAYDDLFTFRDGLIAQVDSYIVPLT